MMWQTSWSVDVEFEFQVVAKRPSLPHLIPHGILFLILFLKQRLSLKFKQAL